MTLLWSSLMFAWMDRNDVNKFSIISFLFVLLATLITGLISVFVDINIIAFFSI